MRRIISLGLSLLLVLCALFPMQVEADTQSPTREINVVYDDSGSMYGNGVDRWCQAKYSMEVFAAMLGESDKMNVYYMSDYEYSTDAAPRIVLNGADGAAANVAKIHTATTLAGNTPFNSVIKAYSDLEQAQADEKWLVVLTDGEFQGVDGSQGIDSYFAGKAADINIMFLSMGIGAAGITENQSNGIYYVAAQDSGQILNNITGICTRIFNSNRLEIDVSSKDISFDVPMGELIVFAQGANVEINGIEKEDGTLIKSSTTPVTVSYSQCDATNYNNAPDTDLLGSIATFKDDFVAGSYSVDVSGAETIEVYYKPNVQVAAYLSDIEGNSVSDLSNLEAGEYTITFGFVKSGTEEKVADSELLGEVTYSATVTNNGVTHENTYGNGDKILLEEGPLQIDVVASYLDYNTVTTSLSYDIYKNKEVTFTVEEDPQYVVTSDGIQDTSPIRLKAQVDGREFTQEEWDSVEMPTVTFADEDLDYEMDELLIEKSDEIGVFLVTPQLPEGKPSTGTYTDTDFQLTYRQSFGDETWQGYLDGTVKMQDQRSWLVRNRDLVIKLAILLLILFILAGYLPCFKKYLPKTLQNKPRIRTTSDEPGEDTDDKSGNVEKSAASMILPYVPQRASIKYFVGSGFTKMSVKAIGGGRMRLTNAKAFKNKDVKIEGERVDENNSKRRDFGAGSWIEAKRKEGITYTCYLDQKVNKKK